MLSALLLLALSSVEGSLAAQGHLEDFEARTDLSAPADGWERVRGAGHPAYNGAAVEIDPSAPSGRRVLVLSSQGGAVALQRSAAAAWPVDPSRPWRLEARVRSTGRRDGVTLAVEWLDRDRAALRVDVSAPLPPSPSWTLLSLDVPELPRAAVFARVRIELAGPDVRADARVDAVALTPVVRLEIDGSSDVVAPGEAASFRLLLRGAPPGEHEVAFDPPFPAPRLSNGRPVDVVLPPLAPGVHLVRADCAGASASRPLVVLDPARPPGPRWMELWIDPSRPGPVAPRDLVRLGGFERARIDLDAPRAEAALRGLADPGARIAGVSASPARFEGLVDGWAERGDAPLLEDGSAAELVRRAVALAASDARPPVLLVSSHLPALTVAALRIADERLAGARPRPAGTAQAAFERDGRATLVFWSDAPDERAVDLGEGVRWIPCLGPSRPHVPGETIRVGPLPLFAVGVDPARLDLQAGLRLAEPRVFLRRAPTTLELRFRNPGPAPLADVRFRLLDPLPAGWEASPRTAAPAPLAPGAELAFSPALRPGPDAAASALVLRVEVSFLRDGRPEAFAAAFRLRAVPLLEVALARDGARATLSVTNRSDRPAILLARVRLPGQAEQLEPLGAVGPGATKSIDYVLGASGAAEVDVEERGGGRAFVRGRFEIR